MYNLSQLFFKTFGYAHVHICHTNLYNWSAPSCYSSTAALNDCCIELTPYTVLANS